MKTWTKWAGWAGAAAFLAAWTAAAWCAEPPEKKTPVKLVSVVTPKALTDNVKKGLQWLAQHQLSNGAWGQGEESAEMGGGAPLKDAASVADTCTAALALMRAGSTPAKGDYAANLKKAVEFVCGEVEESDKDSLYVTKQRGTRVQSKLGTYIDTFMAAMLLAEVKGAMGDETADKRVADALDKVLAKIQKNQRKDGTWEGSGWAPAVSQGMATGALNRAAQAGAKVDEKVRARAEDFAQKQLDATTGKFATGASAGVELYAAASSVGNINASAQTNSMRKPEVADKLARATTDEEREAAKAELKRFDDNEVHLKTAEKALGDKLNDPKFLAGFGSNGGEEFLSYMSIGEVLITKDGDDWTKWDKSMTENMNRIQNADGSWTGHHCITGRTFCTSAALLVLTVDRATVPVASIKEKR